MGGQSGTVGEKKEKSKSLLKEKQSGSLSSLYSLTNVSSSLSPFILHSFIHSSIHFIECLPHARYPICIFPYLFLFHYHYSFSFPPISLPIFHISLHISLYMFIYLLIHSFSNCLGSTFHVTDTLSLHPSLFPDLSPHLFLPPHLSSCFPSLPIPISTLLFPTPFLTLSPSLISPWVEEGTKAGEKLTSSLWGPITLKCSRQKSVVAPATRRKEKRLRHKHRLEAWGPPAFLGSSSASSTSRIMLSVLMVSFPEGLKSSWEMAEPWGSVCQRERIACFSGSVLSERLFPGGSGVASLSPGWSPGVLAEETSAGWLCKQLHLYAWGEEEEGGDRLSLIQPAENFLGGETHELIWRKR